MSFSPGDNVGPYTIIEQLGQGGMATVFKAYHAALDRNVAIKVLHPAFTQDPQFQQRFQREARVVAKLEHPNIVPIYDYAEHEGQAYLVMKYIEGRTLKAVLDQGWPSKQEILRVVKAVGSALTYAHAKGILHRDVKPSNILLTDEGGVFLADFGLARMAEAGQSTLSGDQLLGTPHYISPEQARGEKDLDEGTDIYSLGIVLYQLSVGRVPYNSDTPFSIIHDHIYKPLPLPRSLNDKIPEALEQVLLKGLAKERGDRFATIAEQVAAFERAVTGQSPWMSEAAVEPAVAAMVDRTPQAAAEPARIAVAEAAGEPQAVAVGVAPQAEPVGAPEPPRANRTRRWPWVAGGLALSVLSLLTFAFAMAHSVSGEGVALTDQPAALQDQPTAQIATAAAQASSQQDALAMAQQAVDEQPGDPAAHMELAEALAGSGLTQNAAQEFGKAAELFLAAADYPKAAEAATRALEVSGQSLDNDLRLQGALTQALYLGAGSQMMPAIDKVELLAPEWPPLQVLRARSLLVMGEREKAQFILEDALRQDPANTLANAVLVELRLASGDPQGAQELADQLLQRDRIAPWLRAHLESQLSKS